MSRFELEEELSYLDRSLSDLESERAAGDLSPSDYERLKADYSRRKSETEQALAALPGEQRRPVESRPTRRRLLRSRRARLLTGWGAFGCFLLAALFLSMTLAGVGPFVTSPGLSRSERVQIMLAEASELGASGKVRLALSTYDKVLALEPRQPQALADGGWLTRLAGLSEKDASTVRSGDAEIEAAVKADPSYAVARAYDGVLLYADRHEPARAASQFSAMLLDHPSAALVWSVRQEAVAAFRAAGQAVPPALAHAKKPAGSS